MNIQRSSLEFTTSRSPEKVLLNKDISGGILSQLNDFRQQGRFTDAILTVDQEQLHCHRCVLAASSTYFEATFSGQFKEAIEAEVELHKISPWVMKKILDYIYSGKLEISLDTALDYLKTGHMLQYPAIVEACCELLLHHLHPNNCLGLKELGALYRCDDLESGAYSYALEHFSSVVERSEELVELPIDSLVRYLSSDNVDISNEAIMWRAIRSWVFFDLEDRKKYLLELLACVRLAVLTSKELHSITSEPIIRNQPKCLQFLEKACSGGLGNKIENLSSTEHSLEKLKLKGYQRGARPSTLPRDLIVMFGGTSGYELTEMVAYDPLKNRWINLPAPPENIVKASITSYNGSIFVTGGIVNNELSKTMWIFCCKERRWSRGTTLLEARARHSSVTMDGLLYISGGVCKDEHQNQVSMVEIHSYDIKTGVWRKVGANNMAKEESTLLGFSNVLYELGGHTRDGGYVRTMDTYKVTNDGSVISSGEHYVLPCTGEPGPLKAVLDEKELFIILWENTGHLFSINTNGRRYYQVDHSYPRASGCLVTFSHHAYILGGYEDGKPVTHGKVLDISSYPYNSHSIALPPELYVHKCVHVKM